MLVLVRKVFSELSSHYLLKILYNMTAAKMKGALTAWYCKREVMTGMTLLSGGGVSKTWHFDKQPPPTQVTNWHPFGGGGERQELLINVNNTKQEPSSRRAELSRVPQLKLSHVFYPSIYI